MHYDDEDGSDYMSNFETTSIDVTGVPEPLVEDIRRLVRTIRERFPRHPVGVPTRPELRGRFADLKFSIPKEPIDEAQAEAWTNFPREIPKPRTTC